MIHDLSAKISAYFLSGYLRPAWWLIFLGYFLAYNLAYILARSGKGRPAVLDDCRRAVAISFAVHALAAAGVMAKWLYDFRLFASFWRYFPWYLAVLILDIVIIICSRAPGARGPS